MTIGPPPRLQDRYRLVEQLGRGSMGQVYKARDELLERDVAIKFITPERLSGAEASARFMREARAIARLSHPNIMTLHDAGQAEGWHYLILELLPGHNLHTLMNERGGALPLRETLPLMRGALKALAHAHTHGLIHRDLKPENIMVAPEGGVKIADFGLAVAHDDVRLTQDGLIVGTILYLAPEVVMGQPADARSDLYAVGAVFYELLTGQPPFAGSDTVSVIAHILHDPLTAPSQFVPGLPAPIEQLITQLLDKDPAARPASAEAVLALLPESVETSAPESEPPALSAVRASASLLENLIRSSTTLEAVPTEGAEPTLPPALLLYAALEDTTDAVEAERRRLAELLNERLMEPLNLLLSQAGIYEKSLSANPTARQALSVLISLLRQMQQQTRDLEANLRPTLLDNLGLEPALESLAAQVMRVHGLHISLTLERLPERLPRPIELALFRAAQEALEHAAGPAHAGQASIHLQKREAHLAFRLTNNGMADNAREVFLPATRQRLEQLGGVLQRSESLTIGGDIAIHFALSAPPPLTAREMEVLQLLAEGLSNKEIAQALSVTPRTVNFHLDNVYSKLGVNSRTEAALYALRHGWIRKAQ